MPQFTQLDYSAMLLTLSQSSKAMGNFMPNRSTSSKMPPAHSRSSSLQCHRQCPAGHPSAPTSALSKEPKPAAKLLGRALGSAGGEPVQKFAHLSHARVHVCSVIPLPVASKKVCCSMCLPLINVKTNKTNKTSQCQSKFPPLPLTLPQNKQFPASEKRTVLCKTSTDARSQFPASEQRTTVHRAASWFT